MTINARWRFADEAPRIGQGERWVIITIGWKWVRFLERSSGRRHKMRREMFDLLRERRMVCINQ